MSITTAQIRGARGILNWSQQDLAQRTGISATSIGAIENGQTTPRESTLSTIRKTFENNDIEFVENGVRQTQKTLQVFEGEDCYLSILDLAYSELSKGDEILFSASDERRSTPQVVEKLKLLRRAGVNMRNLIKHGDTHLMGKMDEYRWMDEDLFFNSDVKAIFSDYVAYLMSWKSVKKVIVIKDENIAAEHKRTFEYIWKNSKQPTSTTAEETYE